MATQVEPEQAGGADQQQDAAHGAEQLRHAGQVVGRGPAEQIVVQRGHAGGGEAQQEAVEGGVVEAPTPQGPGVVLVVAAFAVAAVQILQAQDIVRRFHGGAGLHRRNGRRRVVAPRRHLAPEAAYAQRQRQHCVQEDRREQRHQELVRKERVEVRLRRHAEQRVLEPQRQQQEEGQCSGRGQRQRQAVALVEPAQRRRPGEVGIGLQAHLGHGLRHVDGELVRRRVLAGVQAGAAVVAQIGQVVHVGLAEFQPARHGRKDGAKAFAVAAGIADLQLARHFRLGRAGHHLTVGQGPRLAGQLLKLLHAAAPYSCMLRAARAAWVPAMRPKAVPMDMPTPAV